jgi:hypothetical protein
MMIYGSVEGRTFEPALIPMISVGSLLKMKSSMRGRALAVYIPDHTQSYPPILSIGAGDRQRNALNALFCFTDAMDSEALERLPGAVREGKNETGANPAGAPRPS